MMFFHLLLVIPAIFVERSRQSNIPIPANETLIPAEGNYKIEAKNVTMYIPEMMISRNGIEMSNATFSAERFSMIHRGP